MRHHDVARAARVTPADVQQVTAAQVHQALADRVADAVLDVATQEAGTTYWRAADRYWMDDPLFGDVVDIAQLDYNSVVGLHVRRG